MDGWRRHDLRVFAAVEEISSTVWEAMESWELSGITPSILRHAKVACVGATVSLWTFLMLLIV